MWNVTITCCDNQYTAPVASLVRIPTSAWSEDWSTDATSLWDRRKQLEGSIARKDHSLVSCFSYFVIHSSKSRAMLLMMVKGYNGRFSLWMLTLILCLVSVSQCSKRVCSHTVYELTHCTLILTSSSCNEPPYSNSGNHIRQPISAPL